MKASGTPADAPLKILFCTLSIFDEVGGIQRFNQRVIDAALNGRGPYIEEMIVISLGDDGHRTLAANAVLVGCSGSRWNYLTQFIKYLFRVRPSVVLFGHINLAPLAALSRLIVRKAGIALFVHGIDVWKSNGNSFRYWTQGLLVKKLINKVISVSIFTAEVMKWEFHLEAVGFEILPNAVDVEPGAKPEIRRLRAKGPARILSVTRLADRYKGVAEVISAIGILRKSIPDIEYHIVGDGPIKTELMEHAVNLNVAENIHFHGKVSDAELAEIYEVADVFALPSRKEGFGIVFLEAWKYGLPVICGNVDASSEVVIDGNCGIVVDTMNIVALAHAIERLVADPNERIRLARNGFKRLLQYYTHEHFVDNFARILNKLVLVPEGLPIDG